MSMNKINEKTRLLEVLRGHKVDRPPVICPGGMMNAAVTEVVENLKVNHNVDSKAMVQAAILVREKTGFENFGVPFCMTAEAEPLGIEVDLGSHRKEPRVTGYTKYTIEEILNGRVVEVEEEARMKSVLEAIHMLKNDDVPVIGNITGPVSTASSVVDPNDFFKNLLKNPDQSHAFLQFINDYLIDYALKMVDYGADVIAVSDPTATGEILGERMFRAYALPYYKAFSEALRNLDVPVIFHMCGKATNVITALNEAGFDALSFDSVVNMRNAKSQIGTQLMGNVNTQALNFEDDEKIKKLTQVCLDSGVDIVSPACGLGMSTPVSSIRVMTDYVKACKSKQK